MNLKFFFGLLLGSFVTSYSMEVLLPGALALRKRLVSVGMEDFVEHTNIVNQLAGKQVMPWNVAIEIQKAMYDYFEYLDSANQPLSHLQKALKGKTPMLRVLLKDHPQALVQLKKDGLYIPLENEESPA